MLLNSQVDDAVPSNGDSPQNSDGGAPPERDDDDDYDDKEEEVEEDEEESDNDEEMEVVEDVLVRPANDEENLYGLNVELRP